MDYSMEDLRRIIINNEKEHCELEKKFFKYRFFVSICNVVDFQDVFYNLKHKYFYILSEYEILQEYSKLYHRLFNMRGLTFDELNNLITKYVNHYRDLEKLANSINIEMEQLELITNRDLSDVLDKDELNEMMLDIMNEYKMPQKIKKTRKRKRIKHDIIPLTYERMITYKTKRILKKKKCENDPYQHKSKYLAITNVINPKFLYE